MAEFALIDRLRQRAGSRPDVALGIGDDAALIEPPKGQQVVLAVDTLVEGVHFAKGVPASAIGWKALAVNLSDLAAMGAEPAVALLALTLPTDDTAFVDEFATGFSALADTHRVALVGGDTTRGPLAASVTVMGYVPKGKALTRAGAEAGDDLWVTGTLGDAAGALALWKSGIPMLRTGVLRERLDRPAPRLGAGLALRGLATACIDVSDGFLADLGHILAMSGVGADVEADALPLSPALLDAFPDTTARRALQLSGGDDYELCFTAPAKKREAVQAALDAVATPATRVGRITEGASLRLFDADGLPLTLPPRRGYVHFIEGGA
ncbi:thiamine-phosphate kinase [Silanimonas sp.]|jgi:thiamine-monophosphate kinase|uniref:thiamine-phosphate kinase n=1 Tax=Silanimonas sp. TaxID=1929290 RepID=UPI0037C72232